MRRIPALLAVTALAAVGLVGCASASSEASCTLPDTAPGVSDLIEVSGSTESAPDVEVRTPFHVEESTSYVVSEGDGARITDEGQSVALDISLFSGATGEPLVATAYSDAAIQPVSLARWSQTFPALPAALQCATEGSRVVVALAGDGVAAEAAPGLGLEEGDSAIAVVDVRRAFLPRADGANQYAEAHGLPTVVRAPDGRPGIIVPEAVAPTEPVAQVLKKGDGDEVAAASSMVLHFTSVNWDDPKGQELRTTWDTEPTVVGLDGVPPAVADALLGATVGSQIMVVEPAIDGADGQSPVPATVFVVDILGIE